MRSILSWSTFAIVLPRALPLALWMLLLVGVAVAWRGTNSRDTFEFVGRMSFIFLMLWMLSIGLQYAKLIKQWHRARRDRLRGVPGK
jgi:hypothetical protein